MYSRCITDQTFDHGMNETILAPTKSRCESKASLKLPFIDEPVQVIAEIDEPTLLCYHASA